VPVAMLASWRRGVVASWSGTGVRATLPGAAPPFKVGGRGASGSACPETRGGEGRLLGDRGKLRQRRRRPRRECRIHCGMRGRLLGDAPRFRSFHGGEGSLCPGDRGVRGAPRPVSPPLGRRSPTLGRHSRALVGIPPTELGVSPPLGEVSPGWGELPLGWGEVPEPRGDPPQRWAGPPQRRGTFPLGWGEVPERRGNLPQRSARSPLRWGGPPQPRGKSQIPRGTSPQRWGKPQKSGAKAHDGRGGLYGIAGGGTRRFPACSKASHPAARRRRPRWILDSSASSIQQFHGDRVVEGQKQTGAALEHGGVLSHGL